MKRFERFNKRIKLITRVERWPRWYSLLGKINTTLLNKLSGGITRYINESIEIKLDARFRFVSVFPESLCLRVMEKILKPGLITVDVGANIGLHTLVMAKLVGSNGKVFSFEPAKESFDALIKHIYRNNMKKIVEPYQLIVGNKQGECEFWEDGTNGTNRIGGSPFQGKGVKVVVRDSITLDQFFEGNKFFPNFIKIDVEGYEMAVLQGAHKTLKKTRCPVLCELHPLYWKDLGYVGDDILKFVRELGYKVFELNGTPCLDPSEYKTVLFD